MGKVKKYLPNIIVAIILIVGIGLLAYPTVSDYINDLHSTRAIGSYIEKTKDLSKEEKERLLKEAKEYNQTLVGKTNRYFLNEDEKEKYNHILDVTDTGIMSYVEIPKLKVFMPIYHGTDEGVLQVAVGHIPGSSFPVGGESTHSLISGHRGLPSAKLFTDIDQLKDGDLFFIYALDETLAYKVNKIRTVLPTEVETLEIEKGKDLVTLITCTPYGVNTHRLLVQGERIDYKKTAPKVEEVIIQTNMKYLGILIGAIVILILILGYVIRQERRKRASEK